MTTGRRAGYPAAYSLQWTLWQEWGDPLFFVAWQVNEAKATGAAMNNELLTVINYLERDRGVNREVIIQAIETALLSAAHKSMGVTNDVRV